VHIPLVCACEMTYLMASDVPLSKIMVFGEKTVKQTGMRIAKILVFVKWLTVLVSFYTQRNPAV